MLITIKAYIIYYFLVVCDGNQKCNRSRCIFEEGNSSCANAPMLNSYFCSIHSNSYFCSIIVVFCSIVVTKIKRERSERKSFE